MSPPHPGPRQARLKQRAVEQLESAFRAAGWKVFKLSGEDLQADILAQRAGQVFAVELEVAPNRSQRWALRGRLADALLVARACGEELQAVPLAVLVAPAISDRLADDLAAYVQRVAPDVAWGLIDERGRFELHHPALQDLESPAAKREAPEPERAPVAHNPFSDLGQWIVKVLLAKHVPEPLLNAPRRPIRGISELAAAANISQPSASRLVAALEAEGFVERQRRSLQVVRPDALLAAWQRAGAAPAEQCFVRRLLPGGDPFAQVLEALARHASQAAHPQSPVEAQADAPMALDPQELDEPSAASAFRPALQSWQAYPSGPLGQRASMSHFAACKAHGLGIVRGAPLHIYSEDLSPAALEALDLVRVDQRAEADLVAIRPRFPESVFRGAVAVDGAPIADALQCWLDVSLHPSRGEEQAEALAERLEMDSWAQ